MKKKIAVTGGIGSGKSFWLNYIRELGYPVFSCDEIYKEVIQTPAYLSKMKEVFSDCIKEGKVDRKALAQTVFYDEEKRKRLNGIAHPFIMETLLQRMEKCASELVFAEVPLLFEGEFENLFDYVLVVERDMRERLRAICDRDGMTEEEAVQRMNAQFDYHSPDAETRFQKCHAFILENGADFLVVKNKLETWIFEVQKRKT